MDLGLTNKVALITGASRGIGKGIAKTLASQGCKLMICARNEETLTEAAHELEALGATVYALPLDVTDPETPEFFAEEALAQFGQIDILVSNVGSNRRKPFVETTDEDWDDIINANLKSHVRCSRAVIPHMQAAGGGSILFVASIFGREAGGAGLSIYNATKSALISLSKIMSIELAPSNIRVNSIAPGSIQFPGGSWDRRMKEDPEGIAQFIAQNMPIGRFGRVEEVADVVAFLVSERASLITGTCLNVDGGQSRSLI